MFPFLFFPLQPSPSLQFGRGSRNKRLWEVCLLPPQSSASSSFSFFSVFLLLLPAQDLRPLFSLSPPSPFSFSLLYILHAPFLFPLHRERARVWVTALRGRRGRPNLHSIVVFSCNFACVSCVLLYIFFLHLLDFGKENILAGKGFT